MSDKDYRLVANDTWDDSVIWTKKHGFIRARSRLAELIWKRLTQTEDDPQ